jgi:hypothetical protein
VRLDLAKARGKLSAPCTSWRQAQDAIPALEDAHGNPVLLGFLEHDIAEMKRLTGGSVSYFRKRIRMALAEGAQVTPQRITYQGKTVHAQAVRIQPYLDDPMHARFEKYLRKTYTFVLSDRCRAACISCAPRDREAGDGADRGAAGRERRRRPPLRR